jgi:hypothetical protein
VGQAVYAIDAFLDDDLLWRIEWIGGVGYNTSVPSEPQIDVCLAQLPKGEKNPLSARPFGGPQQVLSYLANYTHRVALSNRRIVAVDAQHQSVTFTYRDYRHSSQRKELTLSALEFIRRFSLHILPPGLVRIRHYGVLGNNRRKRDMGLAQQRYVKSHRIFAKCRCIKDFRRFRNSQIGDLFSRSVLGA